MSEERQTENSCPKVYDTWSDADRAAWVMRRLYGWLAYTIHYCPSCAGFHLRKGRLFQ